MRTHKCERKLRTCIRDMEERVSHLFDGEAVENVVVQGEQPVVVNIPTF